MTSYRERPITFLGPVVEDGRIVKQYAVAAVGDLPRADVLAAGVEATAKLLPAGVPGFRIVHQGADGCYYLACWWALDCILHFQVVRAPIDSPSQTTAMPEHAFACTWELVPVAYERDAWVRHLMRNEGDLDSWSRDGFTGNA